MGLEVDLVHEHAHAGVVVVRLRQREAVLDQVAAEVHRDLHLELGLEVTPKALLTVLGAPLPPAFPPGEFGRHFDLLGHRCHLSSADERSGSFSWITKGASARSRRSMTIANGGCSSSTTSASTMRWM